ncbi:unnamed protein product [Caenorhabditis sp. 36 PRJEB53466]|nr:unnamed protein product [Caenorhabditis sp. 36 PRJEB53466]
MLRKNLKFLIFLIIASLDSSKSTLLNQCYESGDTCIRFEKGHFEFVDTVQLTGDNVPTLKANSSTSTRIVLSELLSHLAFNHSSTLAALVVNAGSRANVQWKISPDSTSEHPIEIQDPDGYDSPYANVTVHCIDIQNYADDAKRSCLVQPVPSLLVRFCPNFNNSNFQVRIDQVDDFIVELSDDLLGINIQRLNKSIEFPIGIMNCSSLMDNPEILGENPVCLGDGENIAVKFGANPKIGVSHEMKTKYSINSAFVKSAKNAVYPNFTISHEKEVATCSNATKFEVKQISGSGFLPLHFEWTILNGTEDMEKLANSTSERLLEIPRNHLLTSNVIIVTGCNLAGKCTSSEPITTDLVDDVSIFSVSIDGYEQETPASFGLRLHANPTFQQCSSKLAPKNVQYEWKLNGEGQMYDDGLKLPAYSYSVDDVVNITLIARYNHEKTYSSSTTKTIHYFGLPLLVTLDCVERQVGEDHDLLIRVLAVDQNRKDSSLTYHWECKIMNGINGTRNCDLGDVKTTNEYIKIPSSKLVQSSIMNITATVSTGDQSDSSSCLVTVGSTQIPTVSFFRLAEKKVNVFDYIRIQALVSSSFPTLNVTWEIVRDSQFGFFNLSSFLNNPTTIIKNVPAKSDVFVSLTIPPSSSQFSAWPGLLSGKTFAIRLWATNEKGSSFADLHLSTNSPPTVGAIDITAADYPMIALETPVTFSVGDGWNDDKDDLPLSYQFGYKIHYWNNSTYEYWGSRSTVKSHQFFLPSTTGNSSEECGERVGITALLSVCDRLGSCISEESGIFGITFSSYFESSYASWTCGSSSSSTCRYVCLGTAWIAHSAMTDNTYLSEDLFTDQIELSLNKSVSDLHQLGLVDPISGTMLTPSNGQFLYSVDIAVSNYKPINYYSCFLYNQNSGWALRQCISSNYAKTVQDRSFVTCNCSATGILGVFLVNAPTPDPLPDHNEILLSLIIDSEVTADDLSKIFARIANLSEVDQKRFVKVANKGNKTIQATLRPPFRSDQKSNSVAVQSIQKAVGYQKILNVITVLNFTYSVVKRDLNGDSNARKITFNFQKSYLTQLGTDADDYARKWAQTMATTLQISEYRFKNYKVFFGVVYNITVTLPFTDEAKPLSAEEIALMIQECSKYGEFDFQLSDESVQSRSIADTDIAMLLVMHETNSLMLALIVVLSVVLGLGTIFICGAVLVKLRTDKLIVEERRRANLSEQQFQLPPPPEYPVDTTPFHVVTDQYPLRRQRAEVRQF